MGYSFLIFMKNITVFFSMQEPGMHAFNFTTKKLALAVLVGWAEQKISCWNNILLYITLYSNSTKTGAGRLEKFSPRRLSICEIWLDLVAWSVKTTQVLDRNACHLLPLAHSDGVASSHSQVSWVFPVGVEKLYLQSSWKYYLFSMQDPVTACIRSNI